eukprot:14777824-Alexandrium_andersonii.AAC.1
MFPPHRHQAAICAREEADQRAQRHGQGLRAELRDATVGLQRQGTQELHVVVLCARQGNPSDGRGIVCA